MHVHWSEGSEKNGQLLFLCGALCCILFMSVFLEAGLKQIEHILHFDLQAEAYNEESDLRLNNQIT